MIRVLPDVVTPAVVTGIDIGTAEFDARRIAENPEAIRVNPILGGLACAGGYILHIAGVGGDYTKNIGMISMPWFGRGLYTAVRGAIAQGTEKRAAPSEAQLRETVQKLQTELSRAKAMTTQPIQRTYQSEFERAGAF